jgi:malonyl-CoA O-methyltransferase
MRQADASKASAQYTARMADNDRASGRRLDAVAVEAALRRLAAAPEPPWLHREVARRMGERLAPIRMQPARILDWWAGPGAGAAALRERYPKARIVAVEPGAGWPARRGVRERQRWWSFGGTALEGYVASEDDAAIGRAQLVWANMMLHGVVDLPALFARWHRLLDIEGVVVFSCLGPGTLRELRDLYAALAWPAPTPGFVDMHDLGDMLVAGGFADPVMDQETLTLSWPSPEALLAELRQLGGNAAPDRFGGLRTPAWRRRLVAELGARAGADGRISLGFEVAYGHGFKPAPRLRAGEPATISLEEMRAMVRRPPGPR